MNKTQLNQTFETLSPTDGQKKRMLQNILKQANVSTNQEHIDNVVTLKTQKKTKSLKPWMSLAASLVLVVGAGLSINSLEDSSRKYIADTTEQQTDEMVQAGPLETSPIGMRKFMNYNGYRYVLMEDVTLSLGEADLGQHLGSLAYPITEGTKDPTQDLATSFALGGEVYALKSYAPIFRVAVVNEGNYYLCESVGRADDTQMDIGQYIEEAQLIAQVKSIEISRQTNQEIVATMNQEEGQALLEQLKDSTFIEPRTIDFETLYNAANRQTIMNLTIHLKDNTTVSSFIVPKQKLIGFGDNYYQITQKLQTTLEKKVSP